MADVVSLSLLVQEALGVVGDNMFGIRDLFLYGWNPRLGLLHRVRKNPCGQSGWASGRNGARTSVVIGTLIAPADKSFWTTLKLF